MLIRNLQETSTTVSGWWPLTLYHPTVKGSQTCSSVAEWRTLRRVHIKAGAMGSSPKEQHAWAGLFISAVAAMRILRRRTTRQGAIGSSPMWEQQTWAGLLLTSASGYSILVQACAIPGGLRDPIVESSESQCHML